MNAQELEDLLTIQDCARELMKYSNPYDRGTPAYLAWSELRVAFRLQKRHSEGEKPRHPKCLHDPCRAKADGYCAECHATSYP